MRLLFMAVLIITPAAVSAQSIHQIDSDFSSEWEATGFNNARAMVRDGDGYFHIVYHSQDNPDTAPGGFCDIFYSHTLIPAPPMSSADWAPAVKIVSLPGDDRYPSIAIEHGSAGLSSDDDTLHVVWQHNEGEPGTVYDILHCFSPNAQVPPPDVWSSPMPVHMSAHNSLVPDIDCSLGNILHVVWQEEGVDPFSEIFYSQSINHGNTWLPSANISMTAGANSQMPDVATIIDFLEPPSQYTYCSDVVHVVWNDDYYAPSPPHILYTLSPDAGGLWLPFEDISLISGSPGADGYPSLTVDRDDIPHVAWMTEILPAGPDPYTPGANPALVSSFPGPDPRMYGVLPNYILYSWRPGMWAPCEVVSGMVGDEEFPSIAVDPYGNLWVGYQNWLSGIDYDVCGATKVIGSPPPWNLATLSNDLYHDDLFPSTATKKAGTSTAGYDLIWTKIDSDLSAGGHFPIAAMSPAHEIWFTGNTNYFYVPVTSHDENVVGGNFFVETNPVLGGTWINTGNCSGDISIYDVSGRNVLERNIESEVGRFYWDISSELPVGIYSIFFQMNDSHESVKVIVLER
ncbi:MAG: T9SS type A sorting domain-containing protein [Candidatus Sabulitectum sp.]|nr:T9SS type A sorting domain-containing protein [Candidatus Sabulitectum sp.]